MRIDERAHFGRCGSSSPAKNTLEAFRISFARHSSKTSRRSLRISSRSSPDKMSLRRPSFASTWRTYLRNVSDGRPDQPRHARSAGPTRTPAASHAPTTPPGTSSDMPWLDSSPRARLTLASEPASNPAWLTSMRSSGCNQAVLQRLRTRSLAVRRRPCGSPHRPGRLPDRSASAGRQPPPLVRIQSPAPTAPSERAGRAEFAHAS